MFRTCPVSKALLVVATLIVLSPPAQAADAPPLISGTYQLDPSHTSVIFKINHLGFSYYTGRFDKMEATLNFNSASPEQSALDVTVFPNSIDTNNIKLEEDLRTDKWLNVVKFPRALLQSTKIERTGPNAGKLTGDFTFLGVTHSITLDITLVGSGQSPITKKQVLGFSATGMFYRSDFGLQNLLPMVGDDIRLEIEAEFDKAD